MDIFSQIGETVSFGVLLSVPLADGVKADQLRCVLELAWMRGAWGGCVTCAHPKPALNLFLIVILHPVFVFHQGICFCLAGVLKVKDGLESGY